MALSNAVIDPTINTLLNNVFVLSLISAYGIRSITDIIICKIKSDNKLFSQLLKKPSVELVVRHKIANGDISTNTFTNIYLNAKLIIKAKIGTVFRA